MPLSKCVGVMMNVQKKKKDNINYVSLKNKTMRFVFCLKKPIKMQIEKKTIPIKNISECQLRILRCRTDCKNRIGNQFENAVTFLTQKKREDDLGYKKNRYNWEITGSRLSSGLCLSGYDRGRRERVSSLSLTCNPCCCGYQMKFVTRRFLYQTRCEIMFLIFGVFSRIFF